MSVKKANPAGVTATFASAVLSLILPASAMSADDVVRPYRDPAPAQVPRDGRDRIDAFRDDPILKSPWGAGDPDLVVPEFHFNLRGVEDPRDRESSHRDGRREPAAPAPADPAPR